MFGVCILAARY